MHLSQSPYSLALLEEFVNQMNAICDATPLETPRIVLYVLKEPVPIFPITCEKNWLDAVGGASHTCSHNRHKMDIPTEKLPNVRNLDTFDCAWVKRKMNAKKRREVQSAEVKKAYDDLVEAMKLATAAITPREK